ncbi:hypothetical protein E2562_009002, partial [Oryza meyeriana var. granulata]
MAWPQLSPTLIAPPRPPDSKMHAVSLELEVLGRHDHPHLTVPFLKVAKASQHESVSLPDEVESFFIK